MDRPLKADSGIHKRGLAPNFHQDPSAFTGLSGNSVSVPILSGVLKIEQIYESVRHILMFSGIAIKLR